MRLLIFGHISHTGFGIVTERLATLLLERHGVDVRVIAVNHRGEPLPAGPLQGRVWPAAIAGDGFGGNISSSAIDGSLWPRYGHHEWRPEQVLVISDMSGFQGHIGRMSPQWLSLPVWHYCPIEGDNLPVSWRDIWNDPSNGAVRAQFRPVAMSAYGRDLIAAHIGREVPLVYHGVDAEIFHAVSPMRPVAHDGKRIATKQEAKRAFGLDPERLHVLRTDRHVPRKFYHAAIETMARLWAEHPDIPVDLVIHCRPQDEGGNLLEEIARLPRDFWPRVKLTQAHDTWRGLSTESLVGLINAADVYYSPTSGEGFGLTLAEAAACEVPVVTTNYAAGPEVVGPGGVLVDPLRDAYGEIVKYHSTYGMDWAVPDARAAVAPLAHLLRKAHLRNRTGEAGRSHVVRSFRWDEAADAFHELFATA